MHVCMKKQKQLASDSLLTQLLEFVPGKRKKAGSLINIHVSMLIDPSPYSTDCNKSRTQLSSLRDAKFPTPEVAAVSNR